MSKSEEAAKIFEEFIGQEEVNEKWFTVDQDQINLFADATHDHQFIHVDPERAKQTPFGTTIAHGFLTLSMLPKLQEGFSLGGAGFSGAAMVINYGLDKVRFPNPVNVDSKIRARRTLTEVLVKGPQVQLKYAVTIDIDGVPKPACVAEMLTRVVYA